MSILERLLDIADRLGGAWRAHKRRSAVRAYYRARLRCARFPCGASEERQERARIDWLWARAECHHGGWLGSIRYRDRRAGMWFRLARYG